VRGPGRRGAGGGHAALDKPAALDATLFFESCLRSGISGALQRSEAYAHDVETTLRERTRQLEDLSADDLPGRADAKLYQAKSLAAQADITVMPEDSAVDIRRIVQRGTSC
jgi:hypothetical protein